MEKNLIIVESPAKSQTIEKYLGEDFVVASSKGHIRDLSTKGPGGFGVEIENNFKPIYRNLRDKLPVVKELKKLVKDAKKFISQPTRTARAKRSAGIFTKFWNWQTRIMSASSSMKSRGRRF